MSLLHTVDALARLQLAAHQAGFRFTVTGAPLELVGFAELVGLGDVLGLEPRWQTEERKEGLRLEEERELADPSVGELDHL